MRLEHWNCRCAFVFSDSSTDKWYHVIGDHWVETEPPQQSEVSAVDLAEMHLGVIEAERIINIAYNKSL